MEKHHYYMQLCQQLAAEAQRNRESPVGSILVHENTIIGKAKENTKTSGDVTQHAEILALKDAISKGNLLLLDSSILYSTHEPCCMCSYVIRHHRIPTIVFQHIVPSVGGVHSEFKVLLATSNPGWGKPPTIITLS